MKVRVKVEETTTREVVLTVDDAEFADWCGEEATPARVQEFLGAGREPWDSSLTDPPNMIERTIDRVEILP